MGPIQRLLAAALAALAAPAGASPISATWTGGDGDWLDPATWSTSPAGAPAPGTDPLGDYYVEIDADDAVASVVSLSAFVAISALTVGEGDRLQIDGGSIALERAEALVTFAPFSFPGAVRIANDGTIELVGSSSPSSITTEQGIEFSGSGTVIGIGGSLARIGGDPNRSIDVVNGTDHTLRGALAIDTRGPGSLVGTFVNLGTVLADASSPLVVRATTTNSGLLRAEGIGAITIVGYHLNTGAIELADGGVLLQAGSFANLGTITVAGAGSELRSTASSFTNYGLIDLSAGATARFKYQASGNSALVRVSSGSEWIGAIDIGWGRFVLDGGVLTSPAVVVASAASLDADGLISGSVTVKTGGTLSIGATAGAIGRLDITNSLVLQPSALMVSEHAGVGVGDILHIGGTWTISGSGGATPVVDLDLVGGYQAVRGDMFEIASAQTIDVSSIGLRSLVHTKAVNGLALVSLIEPVAQGSALRVRALAPTSATWTAASGAWSDASLWSFDVPLAIGSSGIPDRDDATLFRVRIGDGVTASSTSLGNDVRVDALSIANGALLELAAVSPAAAAPTLWIEGLAESASPLALRNDGTLRLLDGSAITATRSLDLVGSGVLALSGGASIGFADRAAPVLANAAQHSIRGSGRLDVRSASGALGDLVNDGAIVADASGELLDVLADVENRGAITATGGGAIGVSGRLANESGASLSAVAGGRIDVRSPSKSANDGAIDASGIGSVVSFAAQVANTGAIAARDGGTIELLDGALQTGPAASITAAADGTVALSTIGGGSVRLDRGTLRVLGSRLLSIDALEGTGRIEGPAAAAIRMTSTTIRPGIDGIGTLDVDATSLVLFDNRLEFELAGSADDEFDRVVSSGKLYLASGVEIVAGAVGSFLPAIGDTFSVVHTSLGSPDALVIEGPLATLVRSTPLANGLYLLADVDATAAGTDLLLRAKAPVVATWTGSGANGSFSDASSWSLDTLLPSSGASASGPTADDVALYHVVVDAPAGAPAEVVVGAAASVESLRVGAANALAIAPGVALTVEGGGLRSGSGVIDSGGTVELRSSGPQGARLRLGGPVVLRGHGELVMSGDASVIDSNELGGDLVQEAGHSLRGTGQITVAASCCSFWPANFVNQGAVIADGPGFLEIDRRFENTGLARAVGAGELRLFGTAANAGTIEVLAGGRLTAPTLVDNAGVLRVEGAGSSADFGRLQNSGQIDVVDGAVLRAQLSFAKAASALAPSMQIARGGSVELTSTSTALLTDALIRLDEGSIASRSSINMLRSRLEGTGRIEVAQGLGTLDLRQAVVTPGGAASLGTLAIDGNLRLPSALLEFDLESGGASDRIDVTGSISLDAATKLSFALGTSFAAAAGDAFTLFRGGSIALGGFAVPASAGLPVLAPDHHWLARVESSAQGEAFVLRVKEAVRATWTGGSGGYFDAGAFAFDRALASGSAGLASEDDFHLFQIAIGDGTSTARVALDRNATVESMSLAAGSALDVLDGATLRIPSGQDRPEIGQLHNDGVLTLSSSGATGILAIEAGLAIDGRGELLLGDAATARIATSAARATLSNGAEHAIRGAGLIDLGGLASSTAASGLLINDGLIEANGTNALALLANVDTRGGLRALGSGGISVAGDLANASSGAIEVAAGSQLDVADDLTNAGSLWVAGHVHTGLLTQGGRLSIAPFGSIDSDRGGAFAVGSVAFLGTGASLRGNSGFAMDGDVDLDGGTIASPTLVRVGGVLAGTGTVDTPRLILSGIGSLRPGSPASAFGSLALSGNLSVSGSIALDIGAFDRDHVAVAGALDVQQSGRIDVSFADGFDLARGESIQLIDAASIKVLGLVGDVVASSGSSSGLALVPELFATASGGEELRLTAKAQVAATWSGGAGSWSDGSAWVYDRDLGGGIATSSGPSADAHSLFSVDIAGHTALPGVVELRGTAEVDRIEIGTLGRLDIAAGSLLSIDRAESRAGSGAFTNDGVIALHDGAAPATLLVRDRLDLVGSGTLSLGESGANAIRSAVPLGLVSLTNGAGHTLRGAGIVDLGFALAQPGVLTNAGTILADAAAPIVVDGTISNSGIISVDRGALAIQRDLVNSGDIQVGGGGRVTQDWRATSVNTGSIAITGDGSRAELAPFTNYGRVVVDDAASLVVYDRFQLGSIFLETPPASVYVGRGAILDVAGNGVELNDGALEIDRGTVAAALRVAGSVKSTTLLVNGLVDGRLDAFGPLARIEVGSSSANLGVLQLGDQSRIAARAVLALEIMGSGAGEADFVEVLAGTLSFDEYTRIEVDVLDPLALGRGDRLTLIDAPALSVRGGVARIVDVRGAGPLTLIPTIESQSVRQQLVLTAKRATHATWNGGDGSFGDATRWSFDAPLSAAASGIPDADREYVYHARIGKDVSVGLDRDASLESLAIASGSSLVVDGGAVLAIGSASRDESGGVRGAGDLVLGDAAAGASLLAEDDLWLDGEGRVVLANSDSAIAGIGGASIIVHQAAGHSLVGMGELRLLGASGGLGGSLENDGLLAAEGAAGLDLVGSVVNRGVMQSIAGTRLSVSKDVTNQGIVEVADSSAALSIAGRIVNEGQLFVRDGATATVGSLSHALLPVADESLTSIDDGAVLTIRGNSGIANGRLQISNSLVQADSSLSVVDSARLVLDDGEIEARRGVYVGSGARVEGSGRIDTLSVYDGAAIAPGGEGVGELLIELGLAIDDAHIEFQLGGTEAGRNHDLLTVLGAVVLSNAVFDIEFLPGDVDGSGFTPAVGDRFDILAATTIEGFDAAFASLPELDGDLAWMVGIVAVSGGSILRLEIVPEPDTAMLVAVGLAALALHRHGGRQRVRVRRARADGPGASARRA